MTSPKQDIPAIATTAPQPGEARDLLGRLCFYLHFAVMIFILIGWAAPWRGALVAYLAFLPLVAVQWQFNKNACILNNVESFLRFGSWRSTQNAEEGAWLMTLIRNLTGIELKPWHVELLTYGVMAALWFAAFGHLRGW
ncbi:MAG TPA: hypothetical protein VHC42_11845 [Rhizomicrobium sp.]|nr:hypothetical protein [Rhizomicrobium sp.]